MPLPALPVIGAVLLEGIGTLLMSATAKILFSLGVGFVTYQGMDILMGQLEGYITQSYAGMPAAAAQIAGLMQLDRAVGIVLGCVTARMVLSGISGGGTIKKMIWK